MEPSVKGTIFKNVVEDVNTLRTQGRVDPGELARRLEPGDLELLEADISISAWYPLECYGRLLQLLAAKSGGDPKALLIESGRQSAQRVIDMGVYAQLDDRTEEKWEERVGRILVSLSGAFFSFGKWQWKGLVGNAFCIEVLEAAPFPEELVLWTQGFVERLASRAAGQHVSLSHVRDQGGARIVFEAERRRG